MSEELKEDQDEDVLIDDIRINIKDKSEIMRMPIDDIIEMARYGDKELIRSIKYKFKRFRGSYKALQKGRDDWKAKALESKGQPDVNSRDLNKKTEKENASLRLKVMDLNNIIKRQKKEIKAKKIDISSEATLEAFRVLMSKLDPESFKQAARSLNKIQRNLIAKQIERL